MEATSQGEKFLRDELELLVDVLREMSDKHQVKSKDTTCKTLMDTNKGYAIAYQVVANLLEEILAQHEKGVA